MRSLSQPTWRRLSVLSLLVPVLAGCGGGTIPPLSDPVIVLRREPVAAPGVHLGLGGRTGNTFLDLLIVSEGIEAPYGFTYEFVYPADLFRFEDFEEGDFLSEAGDVATRLEVAETEPGVVRVVHTRVGDVGPAPGALVSGVLLSLGFRAHSSGDGAFSFRERRVLDEAGAEIGGVTWVGASVTTDLAAADG